MTFTVTVQRPASPCPLSARAGTVAPLRAMRSLPGTATRLPPQVVDALFGVATCIGVLLLPSGRLSSRLAALIGFADRLTRLSVRVTALPSAALLLAKAFSTASVLLLTL